MCNSNITVNSGASTYRVRVESNETDDRPTSFTARTTQYTVTNLRGGTWYTLTVFSRGARSQEVLAASEPYHVQTGILLQRLPVIFLKIKKRV